MQPLLDATEVHCAEMVLDSVPPVVWFIRRQMRSHRKDLSLPQFRILCCLHREPNASLSTVADSLGSSMPTASRIVSGLVNKGLLERAGRDGDRRQLSLQLTDTGLALMERARAGTQQQLRKELRNLTPAQRKTLTQAMLIFQDIFGSAGISPGGPRKSAAMPTTNDVSSRVGDVEVIR